jgi:hypothetical protein
MGHIPFLKLETDDGSGSPEVRKSGSLVVESPTRELRSRWENAFELVSDIRRKDFRLSSEIAGLPDFRTGAIPKHTDAGNVDDAKAVVVALHCVVRARCVGVVRWIMGSVVKSG